MTETENAETHLIDALREYAEGEEPPRDDDETIVDVVLARLQDEPMAAREGRRLRLGFTLSAAALASAAGVALWLAWPRPGLEGPDQVAAARDLADTPVPAGEAIAEPAETPAGTSTRADEVIVRASARRSCFRLGGQPSRCVEPGESVALPRFSDSGAVVVLTVVIGEIQLTMPDGVARSVGEGERVRLAGPKPATIEEADPGLPEVPEAGAKARIPAVGELLERALAQRTAGRVKAAARTYRDLIRLHPRASAARTALVSLGQLELADDPAAALRSFDRYLEGRTGVLREEASYGRIRALRGLGRRNAERTAIERHLVDHPDGMYAAQLRSRLAALVKEEK